MHTLIALNTEHFIISIKKKKLPKCVPFQDIYFKTTFFSSNNLKKQTNLF